MKSARELMTTPFVAVQADDPVEKVGSVLLESGHHSLPVLDKDGRLVGMIGERDLIDAHRRVHLPTLVTILDALIPLGGMHEYEEELRKVTAVSAAQLASTQVITAAPDEDADAVAEKLLRKDIHAVPVVDGEKRVIGIITRSDVLRNLLNP
ncbi:CBS domain-containing protein [Acidithiobacillus sulfuriphilus]|jgi:CBS domain-containing protein|uniref:CBS domain-containing protein n=2 Tax=Acidithiobacillus sulfuriphilus TaxID=1867749 RepID=A0A3M8QZX3_9PROT|nr:CBS domain-containing protein [Acidithiobacillus sulfuriphilus]MCL5980776.1 CBS domain-containing protein [Gammaproteobacteria bacterium]RNF60464.1 CBS domain-containing protein [Acidithiobacillus sulfuriphilus]